MTFIYQEHAKPLREKLTYYMLAHPFNEKMPLDTRKILQRHNIAFDYSTPGYYPWMPQQNGPGSQIYDDEYDEEEFF